MQMVMGYLNYVVQLSNNLLHSLCVSFSEPVALSQLGTVSFSVVNMYLLHQLLNFSGVRLFLDILEEDLLII